MNRDRTRGVLLSKVKIPEDVLVERLNDKIPHKAWEAGQRFLNATAEDLWYVEADGKHYTLGTEGVGWEFGPDKPLQVEFSSLSWVDANGDIQHSWGSGAMVGFTEAEALQWVDTSDQTDLADIVRVFGDRLERNFSLWYSRLSK